MNEPVLVTLLVIDVFEMLDVPYLIGGSFASTAYGRVRTTQDVDIIASMRLNHVGGFIKAIEPGFYVDENMIHMAISRRTNFNLVHLETMFKVDIFLPKNRPFDHQQLDRRIKRVIDRDLGREVYFSSPEDTVLAKLERYRLGGGESEIQWHDILAILQQRSDQLEINYLKESAEAMHVADLLERALEESQI